MRFNHITRGRVRRWVNFLLFSSRNGSRALVSFSAFRFIDKFLKKFELLGKIWCLVFTLRSSYVVPIFSAFSMTLLVWIVDEAGVPPIQLNFIKPH